MILILTFSGPEKRLPGYYNCCYYAVGVCARACVCVCLLTIILIKCMIKILPVQHNTERNKQHVRCMPCLVLTGSLEIVAC